MKLLIVAGCANPPLAEAIAAALGLTLAQAGGGTHCGRRASGVAVRNSVSLTR